jgi:hypothetical protein
VNLDDELRRIFSDEERLDLPLRDDAVSSVVAGARRIRRRRLAAIVASGTLVVAGLTGGTIALAGLGASESPQPVAQGPTAVPTTIQPITSATAAPGPVSQSPPPQGTASKTITNRSTTPPPPARATIGPSSYNGLALGMPAQVAESTGAIVANSEPTSSKGCLGYDYKGSPNQPNHYSVLISPNVGVVRIAGRSDAITPEGLTVGAPESEMKRLYPTPSNGHRGTDEWVTAVPANSAAQYWIIVRNQSVAEIRIELKSQDCYI